MEPPVRRLTAAETAARLGVKPATLYAYVSRGLLSRERGSGGSSFDPIEVERFAARRRRYGPERAPVLIKDGRPSGGPLMTIDTDVALIEDDALYLRGLPADELARGYRFEQVCRWIWTGADTDRPDATSAAWWRPLPGAVDAVRAVDAAMPDGALITDRVRAAIPVVAAVDPIRDVTDPESVGHRAGALIMTLARGLADADAEPDAGVAESLAGLLLPADEDRVRLAPVLDAALVLLLDHDLAVSTLAARAAASARANPYAVVISGLGALDSTLHGNASRAVHRMLTEILQGRSARGVIGEALASGRTGVPGIGHRIYRTADPRAELIMQLLAEIPEAADALDAAAQLTDIVTAHGATFRNVDLALGVLSRAGRMPAEAGEVIFALARIGGWIAHALDEYERPGLRLRPVGRYVGR